ncbi:MAG: hypothetical protein HQK50_14765 [Oligoflexia bacterium]|nr:hypothetical protein [Oligoflexia bacterium]MBF0366833.1 hypothetical protein [Oligoflexia bacterium]
MLIRIFILAVFVYLGMKIYRAYKIYKQIKSQHLHRSVHTRKKHQGDVVEAEFREIK